MTGQDGSGFDNRAIENAEMVLDNVEPSEPGKVAYAQGLATLAVAKQLAEIGFNLQRIADVLEGGDAEPTLPAQIVEALQDLRP